MFLKRNNRYEDDSPQYAKKTKTNPLPATHSGHKINDNTKKGDIKHQYETPRKSLIISPRKKIRPRTSTRKHKSENKADKGSGGYPSTATRDQ